MIASVFATAFLPSIAFSQSSATQSQPSKSDAAPSDAAPSDAAPSDAAPSDAELTDAEQTDSQWRSLLGDDLDDWVIHIGVPHKTVTVPGGPPSTSEDGKKGTPIGNSDPLKIYTIEQVDGEPVLHISGQVFGGLSTQEMFGDYHLSLQYKWGEKKWEPRLDRKRDSGILIHCTGPAAAMFNVWMRSLECQVQETDTGDLYALAGTSACVTVDGPSKKVKTYQPGGELLCVGTGGAGVNVKRSENHESEGWNHVEIMAVGDEAVYRVNGKRVMHFQNSKNGSQAKGEPLTGGHIQIQSEGAEVFYRRIKIRPLKSIPAMSEMDEMGNGKSKEM